MKLNQSIIKKHILGLLIIQAEHYHCWIKAREDVYDKFLYKKGLRVEMLNNIYDLIDFKEIGGQTTISNRNERTIQFFNICRNKSYNKQKRNEAIEEFLKNLLKEAKSTQ